MVKLLQESQTLVNDEVVTTKHTETIDAFSSHVIYVRTGTAHTGMGLNVMTQALCSEDGSLPQGLMVQNTYTELHNGSKNIAMIVTNSMAYPQTLRKKTPVARAVTATKVPEPPMQAGVVEALDEAHSFQVPRLTVKQRQESCLRS